MKKLARSIVRWPQIDKDMRIKVKRRECCQNLQESPAAPIHPEDGPIVNAGYRVHVGYMYVGPFRSRMFLLLIDS